MKKTKVKKQKTLKKQGCSLFLLLMLLALAPVVLATVILSTTSLRLTRTNLEGSVQTTLHVTADNLAKYCKENEITAMTIVSVKSPWIRILGRRDIMIKM